MLFLIWLLNLSTKEISLGSFFDLYDTTFSGTNDLVLMEETLSSALLLVDMLVEMLRSPLRDLTTMLPETGS